MSDLSKLTHGYQAGREAWMDRVIERLEAMERRISSGDVSHQEFDEVGLTERIDLLRGEIRELEVKIADVENNDNFY